MSDDDTPKDSVTEGIEPQASGGAPAPLRMRSTPEDFRVIEEPLYPAIGEGKHTFILIEKRGRTTEQVAGDLSRESGVSGRDVGYAGRKDRHAVTQQWFSLEGVDPERALEFELEDAKVLEAIRHDHKIRTGHLLANRFDIVLRGDVPLDVDAYLERAAELIRRGLPNRYGDQRFGRDGDNAEKARELLAGGRPPRDRRKARFLVSALQSEVFNAVLEAREDAHDKVMLGDIARVEESGGLFWVDDVETDLKRAAEFEISATGPIFGTKVRAPRDETLALEMSICEQFGIPAPEELSLPRGIKAKGTRRPLRIRPQNLEIEPVDEGTGLRVQVALPSGSYVTVLLAALVGEVEDVMRVKRFSAEPPAPDVS